MKKKLLLICVFFNIGLSVSFSKAFFNTDTFDEFGYLIHHNNEDASVWWSEGLYKVMKDTPIPSKSSNVINIWSAKNEFESFVIVIHPFRLMKDFTISVSDFKDNQSNLIFKENISIRKVEYVNISEPTDASGYKGWWPDPLPLFESSEILFPHENQSFWITVKVPEDIIATDYFGEIILNSNDFSVSFPIKLKVWNFELPTKSTARSAFGLNFNLVKEYENLNDSIDIRNSFEYYMKSFRDYKISPYDPFLLTPIKESISGISWEGGFYDDNIKYSGKYSYKIMDNSRLSNVEGKTIDFIPVKNSIIYKLTWYGKSEEKEQEYVVGVECYDANKKLIPYQNRFDAYLGIPKWEKYQLYLSSFDDEIKFIKIRLFPSYRTRSGTNIGTMWFDDVSLINTRTGKNEFVNGDFEVDIDNINFNIELTDDFKKSVKKYFNEYGFTGFRLMLKGIGSGSLQGSSKGSLAGFKQGSSEYLELMKRYLPLIQSKLDEVNLLGKEYIYWFDEPVKSDYPFVKETSSLIKEYAPNLTTFLTEHTDADISEVIDISCTVWSELNHNKIKKTNKQGKENWSYLCTAPKSPWINLFIDQPAINFRMWLWASYVHQLKGILIWQTTYWDSPAASPEGYLQNPWNNPRSFFSGGLGIPWGKQRDWGNGDGRLFYPLNREPNDKTKTYVGPPVPSLRLEILRDGIEDFEYLTILEDIIHKLEEQNIKVEADIKQLLIIPEYIYTNEKTYSKNPQNILEYRKNIAESIEYLKSFL